MGASSPPDDRRAGAVGPIAFRLWSELMGTDAFKLEPRLDVLTQSEFKTLSAALHVAAMAALTDYDAETMGSARLARLFIKTPADVRAVAIDEILEGKSSVAVWRRFFAYPPEPLTDDEIQRHLRARLEDSGFVFTEFDTRGNGSRGSYRSSSYVYIRHNGGILPVSLEPTPDGWSFVLVHAETDRVAVGPMILLSAVNRLREGGTITGVEIDEFEDLHPEFRFIVRRIFVRT